VKDSKHIDHRSDIYSLGAMLYLMVTGKTPYDNTLSNFDLFNKVVNEPIAAIDKHPDIDAIVKKATAKNVNDRYSDCGKFLDDLKKIKNDNNKGFSTEEIKVPGTQDTISDPYGSGVSTGDVPVKYDFNKSVGIYADRLSRFSKTLKASSVNPFRKSMLLNKPWNLIENGSVTKQYIFKDREILLVIEDGNVSEEKWYYLPETGAVMVNISGHKILMKEKFIDDNLLVFTINNSGNSLMVFANENKIPDHKVLKYLKDLFSSQYSLTKAELLNGYTIQIINYSAVGNDFDFLVEFDFDQLGYLPDGDYITKKKKYTLDINSGKIVNVYENIIVDTQKGTQIEFIGGVKAGNKVTSDGVPVMTEEVMSREGDVLYKIESGILKTIYFIKNYTLSDGTSIKVKQKDKKISKGDVVIEPALENGEYKIKGRIFKVNVIDNVIK
jgi:hypothetical protein